MIKPSLAAGVEMSFSERLKLEERPVGQQKIPLDDAAELANFPAWLLDYLQREYSNLLCSIRRLS